MSALVPLGRSYVKVSLRTGVSEPEQEEKTVLLELLELKMSTLRKTT